MGQITALFYKQWILTKRQKAGCICQTFLPLACLVLIYIVLTKTKNLTFLPERPDDDGVTPAYALPANFVRQSIPDIALLSTKLAGLAKFGFITKSDDQIARWYMGDKIRNIKSKREELNELFTQIPQYFSYKDKKNPGKRIQANFIDANDECKSEDDENNFLVENIRKLNELTVLDAMYSTELPDVSIRVEDYTEKGITLKSTLNNIAFGYYHRNNGFTSIIQNFNPSPSPSPSARSDEPDPIIKKFVNPVINEEDKRYKYPGNPVPTEGYISLMNLVSNMFLGKKLGQTPGKANPKIISLISPTLDSSLFQSLIGTIITLICASLIPIALCLGFPLMLFVLVLEKEESISDLLNINGLRSRNYWITFMIYNFIFLNITTTVFYVCGVLFVELDFFRETSYLLIVS